MRRDRAGSFRAGKALPAIRAVIRHAENIALSVHAAARVACWLRQPRVDYLDRQGLDAERRREQLATERAGSARDYMVGHGVDATRFTITALGSGDSVVVVVAEAAPH